MKRTLTHILCAALVLAAALSLDARQASAIAPFAFPMYTVTDLGTLGGASSSALDINAAGQIVGGAYTASNLLHPFLYSNGVMMDIGTLGGCCGLAAGINATGQIVGQADNAQGARRGFLYSNGVMTEIPTLGGSESRASQINASGQIVGQARVAATNSNHAYLYENGQIFDLGTLGGSTSWANSVNASGQIVGGSVLPDGRWRAYRYSDGVMVGLPTLGAEDTSWSVSFHINDAGQIAGWSEVSNQGNCLGFHSMHGFVYSNGQITDVGTLGGSCSIAYEVGESGQVVGQADTSAGRQHAFLYISGMMQDLNDLIPAGSGWELSVATGMNEGGQIVGYGLINGQTHAFLLTPRSPADLIDDLIGLVRSFNLPRGIENSLIVKLQNAQAALAAGDTTGACNTLTAFAYQVNAQAGKTLTTDQTAQLLAGAEQIRAVLGCP
jgi:probable HAF family extracellular repeat protein